jgi:hypothetical protein
MISDLSESQNTFSPLQMPLYRIVNHVTACEVLVRGRSGHSVVFLSSICTICFKPDGTASRLIALTCTVRVINLKHHGRKDLCDIDRAHTCWIQERPGGQTSDEAFVNTPAGTLGPAAVAHGTHHKIKTASCSQNPIYFTRSQFIPQMQLKKWPLYSFLSDYIGFPLSVSFQHCSISADTQLSAS